MASSSPANAPSAPQRSLPSTQRLVAYAVFVVCLGVLPVLRYGFLRANTATFDEFTHLQAGYRYWQCGEFANNPEHPPLVKFVAAAPIRNWQISGYPTPCGTAVITSRGMDVSAAAALFQSPFGQQMLWKARALLILFPILLLVAVFFATWSWFGETAAAVAAILVTVEPTVLAHGSLVTTDVALTATLFTAVWMGVEAVRHSNWLLVLGSGVFTAAALAAKHSGVVLPLILLATMTGTRMLTKEKGSMSYRNVFAAWVLISVIGITGLWGSYGFRYSALPHESNAAYDTSRMFAAAHMEHSISARATSFAIRHHLLPEAYVAGLSDILTFNKRPTFIFGKWRSSGVWYYFPAALSIKLPLGLMVFFAAGICCFPLWREKRDVLAPILLAITIFLAFAMRSKMNIGVRHVLPIVPFVIVLAAAAAARMMKHSREMAGAAAVLILTIVFSALHAAPRQLSYANELFGGSNHLYALLGDSNIDWGQGSGDLHDYLETQHLGGTGCAVASGTLWRTPSECLELPNFLASLLAPHIGPAIPEHLSGTVVVQPFAASWSSAYVSFLNRKPEEVHGNGTILVYRGSFDVPEIAALSHLYRGFYYLARLHDPAHAAEEFTLAQANCPESDREFLATMTFAAKRNLAPNK